MAKWTLERRANESTRKKRFESYWVAATDTMVTSSPRCEGFIIIKNF